MFSSLRLTRALFRRFALATVSVVFVSLPAPRVRADEWRPFNVVKTYETGLTYPWELAFDGANIWVSSNDEPYVVKLRASDGANLGTFVVGANTGGIAYGAGSIWVSAGDQVLRLNPDDGTIEQAFDVSGGSVLFDGIGIWVTSSNGTVTNISVDP